MKSPERALQIWYILLNLAHNRQTITYKALADMINFRAEYLSQSLSYIMRYCENNKLPPLTILVVRKHIGKPAGGFTSVTEENYDKAREKVYEYNWQKRTPIQIIDLEKYPPSKY